MERLGVTNVLLIVTDKEAAQRIGDLGISCYLANHVQSLLDPGNDKFMDWSTNSYVKFVNVRPSIIRDILKVK